jgi:hypothetical protein
MNPILGTFAADLTDAAGDAITGALDAISPLGLAMVGIAGAWLVWRIAKKGIGKAA